MKRSVKYTDETLERGHRLVVRIDTESRHGQKARVTRFFVKYQAEIGGAWRTIVEYDNCHGAAHLHYFSRDGTKGKATNLAGSANPATALRGILTSFKGGLYRRHKEWYSHR